jgi:hypothetical protein
MSNDHAEAAKTLLFSPAHMPCLAKTGLMGLTFGAAAWFASYIQGGGRRKAPLGPFVVVGSTVSIGFWLYCRRQHEARKEYMRGFYAARQEEQDLAVLARRELQLQEELAAANATVAMPGQPRRKQTHLDDVDDA